MNMELQRDVLGMAGFEVVCAWDAEEGIPLAREQHPDVILMDIGLPGIDGLEACRRLKNDPATRDIPVVALTAHAMEGDRQKAEAAGCAGYVVKPITVKTFAASVAQYANTPPDPRPE